MKTSFNRYARTFIAFLMLALIVSSCKRTINKDERSNLSFINYEYFTGRAKMLFDNGLDEVKGIAHIRMKADSIIWISVRSGAGIEGARALITQDSILLVDVLHKEYYAMSFAELREKISFNINLEMMQSMITGNAVIFEDIRTKTLKSDKYLTITQFIDNMVIESNVLVDQQKLEKIFVRDEFRLHELTINFSDFKDFNQTSFAYERNAKLDYAAQSGNPDIYFDLSFNRVNISEEDMRFPFNIPDRYVQKEFTN